jgi:hypothetical protein
VCPPVGDAAGVHAAAHVFVEFPARLLPATLGGVAEQCACPVSFPGAGTPPAWCTVARWFGACAGQFTAERVKTRMAAAVVRIAQPARTSRLRAASVVVLVIPQMSCSPAPVWSSTP